MPPPVANTLADGVTNCQKAQLDVLKQIHTLEDVVKEAARSADIPVHMGEETLVRMNSYLMARRGKDVSELYDPVSACV